MHYEEVLGPAKGKLFSPSPVSVKERGDEDLEATTIESFKAPASEKTVETNAARQSELRIEQPIPAVDNSALALQSPSPVYKKDERKSSVRSKKSRLTDRIVS